MTGTAYSATALSGAAVMTRGVFHQRFVIPAGATQMSPFFQLNAGTGMVAVGQVGFYNAT